MNATQLQELLDGSPPWNIMTIRDATGQETYFVHATRQDDGTYWLKFYDNVSGMMRLQCNHTYAHMTVLRLDPIPITPEPPHDERDQVPQHPDGVPG